MIQKMIYILQKSLLLRALLDTTMKGCDVDTSLLFDEDQNEGTDQHDGNGGGPNNSKKSLYHLISESDVEVH